MAKIKRKVYKEREREKERKREEEKERRARVTVYLCTFSARLQNSVLVFYRKSRGVLWDGGVVGVRFMSGFLAYRWYHSIRGPASPIAS